MQNVGGDYHYICALNERQREREQLQVSEQASGKVSESGIIYCASLANLRMR